MALLLVSKYGVLLLNEATVVLRLLKYLTKFPKTVNILLQMNELISMFVLLID